MFSQKQRVNLTVLCLLVLLAGILFAFFSSHQSPHARFDPAMFDGTLLTKPRPVSPFSLTGTDNAPFTEESLKDHWTLVFFGFTRCGHVCPTTMAELASFYRTLEAKGITPMPRVVMISVDPEHDSVETLSTYVHAFNAHFEGARGEEDAVRALAREMGVAFEKVAAKSGTDIQHSGTVMLINPAGALQAFFTPPLVASKMAKDYGLIIS